TCPPNCTGRRRSLVLPPCGTTERLQLHSAPHLVRSHIAPPDYTVLALVLDPPPSDTILSLQHSHGAPVCLRRKSHPWHSPSRVPPCRLWPLFRRAAGGVALWLQEKYCRRAGRRRA